ncbi:MAG: cytochrome c biogenesis protein CcdA [Patescibacteria group bacterium]
MTELASFLAGLTDSYNPCSLGVLFISLTLLINLKQGRLIWLFGISYLSAIFVTYFVIGLGILRAFHLFGIHNFFGFTAGIVLIVVGLIHLFPSLFPNLPVVRWLRSCHLPGLIKRHMERGVFVAGIILGFLIGLCNLPCAGGVYLGIISYLALKTTYWQGVLNLLIFNLGFILPLVVVFILATRPAVLAKLQTGAAKFARYGVIATSVLMIAMGVGILIILSRL